MLLSQIEAFVEVARTRTVSRAADALFVTQPALTARLQRLEAELDTKLFVRTPRGMKLTEAGDAFLPHAVKALDSLADGRRIVNAYERGGAGRLALGAAPAISTYVLPGILKRFATSHPRVSVSVRTGHSEEVLELVLREQVDIGLVRELRHPDIVSTPLYEDRVILVVEPGHRLAGRARIRLDEISREQLVLFDRTSSYSELTSAGFGVALIPYTAVADELDAGLLRRVEIEDAEPLRRQIVAVRRRDRSAAGGAAESFLATLREMQPELSRTERALQP